MTEGIVAKRLTNLGVHLPAAPKPVGAYVPSVGAGELVFTSGQLPFQDGKLAAVGAVPAEVPVEAAQAAARQATLNVLAVLQAELGSLDRVKRVVRLNVFVNSSPGFTEQAKVADGASELLAAIFGDAGVHTRCAIGAAALPLGATVELDLIVQTK